MKNAKILLALLLVLSLVLAGCGSKEPVAGEVTPQTEEKPLSVGRIEGGIYTNTYAGFGCEMDADWSFYSAEELQELPGEVQNIVEGSEMAELMEGYAQIFDLQAENINDLLAVNVVYTQIPVRERLVYAAMNEEETIDSTLKQSDMIIQSYTQAGMVVESMEKIKVTFLGEEHYAVYTVAETQGIPIYMVQIMNYDLGSYGVTMTATSYMEDHTQDILDMFYVVE